MRKFISQFKGKKNKDNPNSGSSGSLVSSMSNNHIHAGRDNNIYNVVGSLEVKQETTALLEKLKTILNPVNAAWDSYEADQRSKCFENTRVQLLTDIKAWINGAGNQAPIFVLDGVAGIGKSTVAQTLAELAAGLGMLGASFFFTRNEEERATAKYFFPTIAFQLARYNQAFAGRIAETLGNDPDAAQKTILQQLSLLIITPLQDLFAQKAAPILIVIDALDECKEDEAETLLTLLAHHIPHLPRIKIFLTTRPEWHIRNALSEDSNHALFHLHEIEDSIVQSDIQLYLNYSLSAQQVQKLFPHRHPPWQPSTQDKTMLCGICGTLFILASTATKFILDTKAANPEKRLARLLEGVSPTDFSGSRRTDVMDRFYIQIIHQAAPNDADTDEIDEWFDRYRTTIGAIIVLQNPLSCQALAQLLGMDRAEITDALLHLHSLIAPGGPDTIFRIHHKSFPDFITNAGRIERALEKSLLTTSNTAQQFLIDTGIHHHQLAAACFHVMDKNLKFNIGNISPDLWFQDGADIESLKDHPFKEELVYAASHWASHVHAAGDLDGGLQNRFGTWAFTHIIAWLEVMSILGQIRHVHNMLDLALVAIDAQHPNWSGQEQVRQMLSDTRRFLLQNSEVVKLAPMHIYRSALPFIPQNTLLYKTYHNKSTNPSIFNGIEGDWDPAALVSMTGHSSLVSAVAFSPNGKTLASASNDDTIRLWDGNTGAHFLTLEGHSEYVLDVAFSPDGTRLASGSKDHTMRLWDVTTGTHLITLKGHSGGVNSVMFSFDGSRLASGSDDKSICLWDAETGAHLITIEGHSNRVNSVAFSPDGSRLASGSNDKSIRLWNAETGAHLITIKGHSDWVNSVTFSPDGLRLASASSKGRISLVSAYKDSKICLWDVQTGAHITTFNGHSHDVNSVAFSPDGLRLASASDDHTIRLWEVATGAHITTLKGHSDHVCSVIFSPNGSTIASCSKDCTVRLWDVTTGAHIITFNGHFNSVDGVAFSPDGSRFVSGSKDCTVRLCDLKGDNLGGYSRNAGMSSDIVSTAYCSIKGIICSPNTKSNPPSSSGGVDTIRDHSYEVIALVHSPNSSRFATISYDKTIQLWDKTTGAPVTTLHAHSEWVSAVAFSPDGSRLASGSSDTTVQLWDGQTGDPILTLKGHSSWVTKVVFSPDSSKLASGGDTTIQLWDGKTGDHIATLNGHSRGIGAIAFSPDGLKLVSASYDKTFRIWDGWNGSHISTINSDGVMRTILFSPGGSTMVSAKSHITVITIYLRTIHNVVRPISLSPYFKYLKSFIILPSTQHSTSLPTNTVANRLIDPLFAHPITSDYPLSIIALGERKNPSLTGLVYVKVPADGDPVMVPFCWFPPHFKVTAFSVDPASASLTVGCESGRILLLDISNVSFPSNDRHPG